MGLMVKEQGGAVQVLRWADTQAIEFGATATTAASALFSAIVRVQADADAHIVFGPTAADAVASTSTTTPISAGVAEYVRINNGDFVGVLSATQSGAGVAGTLWITEIV